MPRFRRRPRISAWPRWWRLAAAIFATGAVRAGGPAIVTAPGFEVEQVHAVPEADGSWVALAVDRSGRLYASDQYGPLYRVTLPAGEAVGPPRVEKLPLPLGSAHGLAFVGGALYAVVAEKVHGGPGLFRARDTDGDGELDLVTRLAALEGTGEHGPHAVVPAPDVRSLYVAGGNGTRLPTLVRAAARPEWNDASALPPVPAPIGSETRGLPPGGWICRTDLDGREWTLVSAGFRNHYDLAIDRGGEIFTFDSDTEFEVNLPWYRPTRVLHAVSGADFGWRPGAAKIPEGAPETLPAVAALGLGSPTGVAFGYGSAFPARYANALFVADWSYGKLSAVHLRESGASYRGEREEIVSGLPLPIVDLVVNPMDGAIYFTTGGRRMQSALYRLKWIGTGAAEVPAAAPPVVPAGSTARARAVRRDLERFHGAAEAGAVEAAWPHLGSGDRFLRGAAIRAVESQPVAAWRERALRETRPAEGLAALLALMRAGDDPDRGQALAALARWPLAELPSGLQLEKLRLISRGIARPPNRNLARRVVAECEALFPAADQALNLALAEVLLALSAPRTVERVLTALAQAPTREEQIALAAHLRTVRSGWSPAARKAYFGWLQRAAGFRGGAAFRPTLQFIRKEATATLTAEERTELGALLEEGTPPPSTAGGGGLDDRPVVKAWTVAELAPQVERALQERRDPARGRRLAGAAGCFACHNIRGEGGALGPDLSAARGRFSVRDLLEAIVDPNREIGDQYGTIVVTLTDGSQQQGRLVNQNGRQVTLNANLFDPTDVVRIDRERVATIAPARISLMPPGLLDRLEVDEVADLMAYLLGHEAGDGHGRPP